MPISPTARIVLAMGTAQTLGWASTYYLPAILARPMAAAIGTTPAGVYAMFSAALLLAALLGPWVGRIVDQRGGRGLLMASNLCFATGLGGMALAQGPAGLAAAWGLVGLGMALGLYETAFATLAGLFGTAAKGPITGITLIAGFASTVGWPLTTLMEAEWGWRGACAGWAVLHLLLGLPLHRWLVPAAPPPAAKAVTDPADAPPAPRHAMAVLTYFSAAVTVASGSVGAHLPTLLQAGGTDAAGALVAASLIGPSQVAARLLQFGALGGLHALAVGGLPGALGFVLLLGAGNGLQTIAKGTLPLAVFGAAGYGRRQGIISAPGRILQAGAPVGFGLLLALWGVGAAWVLVALSATALLALALLSSRSARRPD